jgi:hypothetical protein
LISNISRPEMDTVDAPFSRGATLHERVEVVVVPSATA